MIPLLLAADTESALRQRAARLAAWIERSPELDLEAAAVALAGSAGNGERRAGVLGEGRVPTGSEEDLRGSCAVQLRGLGIVSARLGAFSPHMNVGYQFRGRTLDNDSFLLTAGFDQLLAPWATFAGDMISEFQVGTSHLSVPTDVTLEAPFHRTIDVTDIPERRDDIINASLGTKLSLPQRVTFLANALFPLNRGALRPDVLWTVGAEYAF